MGSIQPYRFKAHQPQWFLQMKESKLREQIFDLLYSQKKPEQAVLQLNRILKTSPEHSEALALRAYALNKLANSRQNWTYSQHALESADRALALNPDDDIALTGKGWALIDLGRAQEGRLRHPNRSRPMKPCRRRRRRRWPMRAFIRSCATGSWRGGWWTRTWRA